MHFFHTNYLLGFFIIPILVFFHLYAEQRKKRLLRYFAASSLWDKLLSPTNTVNRNIKFILLLAGSSFFILALAQPRWGFQWQEVTQRGTDIIIALDVSKSMLAEDVSPNRLTRAKREIIDFLHVVEGDRLGLIAFAGVSFLQSPLTLDYKAIEIFLDDLDTNLIPIQGTAFSHALNNSIKAFSETPNQSKALILITDGEEQVDDLEKIAETAKEEGIKIFVIGVGELDGAPIPEKKGGFLKNRKGELVISKLNESQLQYLAQATGGSYVRSVASDIDLEYIYFKGIKGYTESQEYGETRRKLWNEQFQWFLLGALLCLIIESLLSTTSKE